MSRLRGLVAAEIDRAIERVVASYRAFASAQPIATDAKEFAAHHAACKAALAHLDLLLKIAKITETPAANGQTDDERLALVAEARAAVCPDDAGETDA